ncbi:PqqD family peptide modification chaperone [Paenibacillus sp. TH7-28]
MKKYLYLRPVAGIKEYKSSTLTLYYLSSPELLQQNYMHDKKQFMINKTAVEIISMLNGLKTFDEIIQCLAAKYSESFHSIESKVKPFMDQLTKQYGYSIMKQSEPIMQEVIISSYSNYYPSVASIELTNRCNIRCRHCYGKYGGVENQKILSLKDLYFILDSLNEIGISILELTGGDPTMNPYSSEAIEKAYEVGISTVMFLTNGIYFDKKLLDTIIKNKHRLYIQIDLHSLNEEYYDWFTNSKNKLQKVKNNIDYLINNGVRVRVCAIITPGNVHELADIGEWAYYHGAVSYAPAVVTPLGRATMGDTSLIFPDEEGLMEFKKQHDLVLEKHPGFIQDITEIKEVTRKNCGAICSQVSINVNGDVKLCNMDSGDYFKLNMGNITTQSIKKVFDNNKDFLKELMNTELPMLDSDNCKDCEQNLFCTNCLLRGFIGARNMHEINKTCEWYQKIHPIVKERFPLYS